MIDDFNHPADPEQPDDLAELFEAYFNEVDAVVDAITEAETEAHLSQLLHGSAPAADIARDLVADAASSTHALADLRPPAEADPGRDDQEQLADVQRCIQDAMFRLASAQARVEAAKLETLSATWEASVARVQAQRDTERAQAYLAEAAAYRNTAVERAGKIVARAQEEASRITARAQADVEAAMRRAQQIVADANTLTEYIRVEVEPRPAERTSLATPRLFLMHHTADQPIPERDMDGPDLISASANLYVQVKKLLLSEGGFSACASAGGSAAWGRSWNVGSVDFMLALQGLGACGSDMPTRVAAIHHTGRQRPAAERWLHREFRQLVLEYARNLSVHEPSADSIALLRRLLSRDDLSAVLGADEWNLPPDLMTLARFHGVSIPTAART